ncbi:hypothetical protein CCH79_00007514 [Gambusia affinis]|uniref:THAP domain-containing protein 1 n=1 Tax=Gambusia affinis TaxID=33528 RepID=A0A315WCC5_GAMAF|nr:hypothetical protein CCH79_00007514 [Gambusia affinis]
MVFTCVIQGCGKRPEPYVRSLHGFPNNLETIKAWNEFVKRTKPYWNGNTPSSRICSEHFLPTCYKNHMAWSMGCVRTLDLIDDFQVPTIYPAVAEKNASSPSRDNLKADIHIQTQQNPPWMSCKGRVPGDVLCKTCGDPDRPSIHFHKHTISRHTADQVIPKYRFTGENGSRFWCLHSSLKNSPAALTTHLGKKTIYQTLTGRGSPLRRHHIYSSSGQNQFNVNLRTVSDRTCKLGEPIIATRDSSAVLILQSSWWR